MKPFIYWEQMIHMNTKADRSGTHEVDVRLRIVHHTLTHGVKPTAKILRFLKALAGNTPR